MKVESLNLEKDLGELKSRITLIKIFQDEPKKSCTAK